MTRPATDYLLQAMKPILHDETWIYHPQARSEETLPLTESESAHLVRVMRVPQGAECRVTNGKGELFAARLTDAHPKRAILEVENCVATQPRPALSLAQAILKNRGLEDVLELCSQVPLARLQPLWTEHVQVSRDREMDKQLERLHAKAVVGLQQSQQMWLPEVLPPLTWDEWLTQNASLEPIWVCDPCGEIVRTSQTGWLAVGPEGGFSSKELALAREHQCQFLGLGPSRLRALSAGFFALARLG
jgi:16S rRNA (uracil1498-N3)-methyltransferase